MVHEQLDLTDDHDAKVMTPEIFQGTTTSQTMDSLMSLYVDLDVTTLSLPVMLTQVWPFSQLYLDDSFFCLFL